MSLSTSAIAVRDTHLHEPTIKCPHCDVDIKLTESLAAPLLKVREAEFARRERELYEQAERLARDRESVDQQVADKLTLERQRVAEEEQRKARNELGAEIESKQRELEELNDILKARDVKLEEAQKAQAHIVRQKRELDERQRELDLTIEQRVSACVGEIQLKAKQEAEEQAKFKVAEKDQLILSMQRQIEELRRKAEQGSQQMQGEVMELELEQILAERFSHDTIMRVPKGEFGGDVMQQVLSQSGVVCGTILWESKRTKNWSDSWLAKLRQDQRAAKAEIAVIVSQALPKNVTTFELIDGVYVVSPQCIAPVATLLRKALLELTLARQSAQGQETKASLVYEYLTGSRFRHRVQAIVEAFDLDAGGLERRERATLKQWAKRETLIDRVMSSTVGMYGDLQGIAGRGLEEIEGLELRAEALLGVDQRP